MPDGKPFSYLAETEIPRQIDVEFRGDRLPDELNSSGPSVTERSRDCAVGDNAPPPGCRDRNATRRITRDSALKSHEKPVESLTANPDNSAWLRGIR